MFKKFVVVMLLLLLLSNTVLAAGQIVMDGDTVRYEFKDGSTLLCKIWTGPDPVGVHINPYNGIWYAEEGPMLHAACHQVTIDPALLDGVFIGEMFLSCSELFYANDPIRQGHCIVPNI